MDFIQENLLSLTIFFPALAALIIFMLPEDEKNLIRRLAFVLSLVPIGLVLTMWANYDRVLANIQFEKIAEWFPAIGASFHIGIDGISLPLFFLTVILTPLAILASFSIEEKVRMYMVLFLIMETAMLGLFASLDLMVFFIFWEIGLVPMYFLIKLWGGKDRDYASFKFFIFTMAGSLGLLLSIQVIGLSMGTFDIPT
ncbi:MAG: NADH-quinone oxidoreductase subunit M, partial [Chloroflexi bacterium]|nr:NADH-quinone oxidoreductase subunit M [Chloroflexota bacterium]